MNAKEYIQNISKKEEIEEYHERAYSFFEEKNKEYNFIVTFSNHAHGDLENTSLKGLIFTVKDCFTTKNLTTTAGSKILENYVPPFDATVVKRIKENGGFIIAKTAMDEFGFGSFSTNYFRGPVRNAIDKEYVAGGSSGGSAVATALAKFPHISIAESTGGSISNPAVFNGVFSLTPTYGLLSRYGLIDYASSLDKPGIMAKCIDDIAMTLDILAGIDMNDSTTIEKPVESFEKEIKKENIKSYKIAYIENYAELADEKIKEAFFKVIDFLGEEGFNIDKIRISYTEEALAAYYIIATSEASTNLAKFCGMRYGYEKSVDGKYYNDYFSEVRAYGFGKEAKRRILLGTFARMSGFRDAYYLKAQKIRTLVIEEFKKYFKRYDILLAPTMPIFPIKIQDAHKLRPEEIYAMDILTVGINLASVPHVNIPIKSKNKFPAGLHIIADHLKEVKALSFGRFIEKEYKGLWR